MIKLLGPIPKETFYVAVSGGIDSMVAYDFFRHGNHKPMLFFFIMEPKLAIRLYSF